jgi:hypothetical protein
LQDDTQPAFLRRLRGEMAGDGSGRHENPIQRNKRLKQDDEEDAPTYVLEDTNQSMSKAEYEAMVAGKVSEKDGATAEEGGTTKVTATTPHAKDTIVEIGKATKKRKVAKVIGEEKDENEDEKASKTSEKKSIKKAKKKGKPVKLSFGDQED